MKVIPVSVIIPSYNSQTIIIDCLESIFKQTYPIKEIIVVDNKSADDSIKIIQDFQKKNKKINIRIFKQKVNKGLTPSYILGTQESKSDYIVAMHSDGKLSSGRELEKLMKPFKDPEVIASYPLILHPQKIWDKYNFWQKLQFARVVGVKEHGLSGKFDCYRKSEVINIYKKLKKRFVNTDIAGGEDWDFYSLLKKEGKVVPTSACVEHLHYAGDDFTFFDYIKKRKHVAKSYGKLLNLYNFGMGPKGLFAFSTKPVLAIASLIPFFRIPALILIILFSFMYTKKMFLTPQTLFNVRILLLPFLNIFLIYYESFWTMESFLETKK